MSSWITVGYYKADKGEPIGYWLERTLSSVDFHGIKMNARCNGTLILFMCEQSMDYFCGPSTPT